MDAVTRQLSDMTVDLVSKLDKLPLDDMPKANEYLREFVVHARKLIYSTTAAPLSKEVVLDLDEFFAKTTTIVAIVTKRSNNLLNRSKVIISGNLVYIPLTPATEDVSSGSLLITENVVSNITYVVLSRQVVYDPKGSKYYLCNTAMGDHPDA